MSAGQPSVVDVQSRPGAGIELRTTWPDMVPNIRKTFDRLYAANAVDRSTHGHNFIVYKDGDREGITMLVAIENAIPGSADPDIKPVSIPAGRAATIPHFGDYGAMRPSYAALEAWMQAQGLRGNGVSLELYGDWYDDPAKVRTDLHFYLR